MVDKNSSVKIIYYTECNHQPIEDFAKRVRDTYKGDYLVKVYDQGHTVGLYSLNEYDSDEKSS